VKTAKFRATLDLAGKTATGMAVPPEVVESLGAGRRPPVSVTINGHTWRSTIAVYGGRFFLGVSAENREKAGVGAGQALDVTVALDTAPREVTVPADLTKALKRQAGATQAFEALSYTGRKEIVVSIEGAKTAETRQRRIDKALAELASAKPRKAR
jgi:hypothetical protein